MKRIKLIILWITLPIVLLSIVYSVGDRNYSIRKSRETAITRAIDKVSPAVASINVIQIKEFRRTPFFNDPFFQFFFPEEPLQRKVQSLGSGVVISYDGYVITNQHVVEGADQIIVTLPGGKEYDAELIGEDRTTDLAILKIEGKNLPYAKLGNSDNLMIGEWVIALGNPFGLFDVNKQPTATVGIVSAINLDFGREYSGRVYQGMIQTDASVNQGNSGGPLCNADGEVIGINTFIFTGRGSEGSIGISFAVPINRAREIAEELKKYGRIDRSYTTGLSVQRVDRFLTKYLELPRMGGVIITGVQLGSSADNAGLQIGDVIYEVSGQPVSSLSEVLKVIEENLFRAGDKIVVKYYRDGKMRTATLKLDELQ